MDIIFVMCSRVRSNTHSSSYSPLWFLNFFRFGLALLGSCLGFSLLELSVSSDRLWWRGRGSDSYCKISIRFLILFSSFGDQVIGLVGFGGLIFLP